MKKSWKITSGVLIVLVIVAIIFLVIKNKNKDSDANDSGNNSQMIWVSHTDPATGISFQYPDSWGMPTMQAGNLQCPDDDSYRTADSLIIRDRELRFADADLANTESFIRSGIMFYKLDPKSIPDCHSELLTMIAARTMTGAEVSSVRLIPVFINGFYGVRNDSASRLDTEARVQYTLFKQNPNGTYFIMQPYFSFIPVADSPEWLEIDSQFRGDAGAYLRQGKTAGQIRVRLETFHAVVQSMAISR